MDKKGLIDQVKAILEADEEITVKVLKKDVAKYVEAVLEGIAVGLETDGKVGIHGYADFVVRTRSAREGKHPKTREIIQIGETKRIGFKAKKALKDRVNN